MSKKHVLIMLACCLIPLVALGAIFLFKVSVSAVILVGVALICPVSHLLMMKLMGHDSEKASHLVRAKVNGALHSQNDR